MGLCSWSYPWSIGVSNGAQPEKKMSALDIMKKAKDYEVNLVQFADNMPLENLTENQLDELAEFSNLNNISIEVGTKGIGVDHLLHFLEISLKLTKLPI